MAWQDFLQNNSLALINTGAGLLSGKNAQEQAANGFKGFAQGMNANKTMQFLSTQHPELAQAVGQGILSPAEAYKLSFEYKTKTAQDTAEEQRWMNRQKAVWEHEASDPNNALDQEYKRAQIDAMNRRSEPENEYAVRERAASQYGLKPDDPGYNSFVLTGKMPREDQAPLTATDKKAILDADDAVSAAQGAIPLIDKALELNDKAYSGPGASWRGSLTATLGNEAGAATMEFDNLVQTQTLGQLKSIFGAAPTEGERQILMDISGSSSQPPEVRKGILERAKAAVERRLEFNRQRSQELRGGSFYKPGGGANGAGSVYKNKYGLE